MPHFMESHLTRALNTGNPLSTAKNGPIPIYRKSARQEVGYMLFTHEVAYGLSAGTEIGDVEVVGRNYR